MIENSGENFSPKEASLQCGPHAHILRIVRDDLTKTADLPIHRFTCWPRRGRYNSFDRDNLNH